MRVRSRKLGGRWSCYRALTPHRFGEETKMYRSPDSLLAMLLIIIAAALMLGQAAPAKPANTRSVPKSEDFATAIKRLRETWVQEFNAGHADKVAALSADEAVLMRRNGSVHNRDSIQAELQRSITREAQNYVLQSLHAE